MMAMREGVKGRRVLSLPTLRSFDTALPRLLCVGSSIRLILPLDNSCYFGYYCYCIESGRRRVFLRQTTARKGGAYVNSNNTAKQLTIAY